jgi:hypothetical protein
VTLKENSADLFVGASQIDQESLEVYCKSVITSWRDPDILAGLFNIRNVAMKEDTSQCCTHNSNSIC